MAEYPTEKELKEIRDWPYADVNNMMEHIQGMWIYSSYFFNEGTTWHVSTGGWSGHEEIISAMQENVMFWTLFWMKSERGGHYEFEITDYLKGNE